MRSLILVLILAAPIAAQETTQPTEPKVVVVEAGVRARPAPVKIVRVAPPARTAPDGAYEGTRRYENWSYYNTGGPARSRASYAVWRARFAPVHPFRYAPQVYRRSYVHARSHAPYRSHTPRYYR